MNKTSDETTQSDVLVLFGVVGDLAYKKIFPVLCALAKRGVFAVPMIVPALDNHQTIFYHHNNRGPQEVDGLIAADGSWHSPMSGQP